MVHLVGNRVTIFCCRYFYTGFLEEVAEEYVRLSDCGVVYQTGELHTDEWKDYQKLPNDWYISKQSIESYGLLK